VKSLTTVAAAAADFSASHQPGVCTSHIVTKHGIKHVNITSYTFNNKNGHGHPWCSVHVAMVG